MSTMSQRVTPRSVVVTPPASEPIAIAEARRHVELASGNTSHDDSLNQYIAAARQQWERDTGKAIIRRTMRLVVPNIYDGLQLPERPITEITSIRFYPNDTIETLGSSVYQLDSATSTIRLGYNQVWPSWAERWDAWEINYLAGEHTSSANVEEIDKQAILLYMGYLFRGNRGDDDRPNDLRAYEALVLKHMRSTYP